MCTVISSRLGAFPSYFKTQQELALDYPERVIDG
jgi:hypothetical protein